MPGLVPAYTLDGALTTVDLDRLGPSNAVAGPRWIELRPAIAFLGRERFDHRLYLEWLLVDVRGRWFAAGCFARDEFEGRLRLAMSTPNAYVELSPLDVVGFVLWASKPLPRELEAFARDEATTAPDMVTLDQAAAAVHRSKRTLERYKTKSDADRLPDPDVEGGGGRPDLWAWSRMRPWLEGTFGATIPGRFPGART